MLALAGYQSRGGINGSVAFAALSGIIFGVVGIGLILTLRHDVRAQSATNRLRQTHPKAPWLWRDDWAAGHIFSEGGANALAIWLFATFWNAIAWPIFYFIYFYPSESSSAPIALEIISVLFPLSGIVLIGLAIRTTLRWLTARGSYFEMPEVPGQIGGTLEGTIRLMPPSRANREFKLVLTCVSRQIDQDSNGTRGLEKVLFKDEQSVRGSAFSGINVHFSIPPEASPADPFGPDTTIVWRLDATAPFSTRKFEARFEVPVFKVERNPEQPRGRAHDPTLADQQAFDLPANFPVRTRLLPTGETELYFPPGRAPAAAVGATLLTAGWSAMLIMILRLDVPIVFVAIWAACDAFLFFWAGVLWLGETRVTLDGSSISLARGVLGFVLSRRTIAASEVHAVLAAAGTRAGNNTYYRLRLTYGDNRQINFADGLSERRTAEWLAREIANRLGAAH